MRGNIAVKMTTHPTHLLTEAKAWLKRKNGPDEVVLIVPEIDNGQPVINYSLYTAYEEQPHFLGRILFDAQGYWIYDGDILSIAEQEQVAKFIINYVETL